MALTAVPYLARRTRLEWLRVSLDYKLTREGMAFIALIFVLVIAGLNTGNNLLYLMLSSLLAAILMSGILSLAVLTGVGLEILLPDHVFARRPVPARIYLQNAKKHVPSFSITLSGAGAEKEPGAKKEEARVARQDPLSATRAGVIPSHLASAAVFSVPAGSASDYANGRAGISPPGAVSGGRVCVEHPLPFWFSGEKAAVAGRARPVGLSGGGADRRVL